MNLPNRIFKKATIFGYTFQIFMDSNTTENPINPKEFLLFDDSTLPNSSIKMSVKRAQELEKTLGEPLMNKFKKEFRLDLLKK